MWMMNDPLDFEREDELLKAPSINKKRKKVIGLDDLLNDQYIEQNKQKEKQSKSIKTRKNNHVDDDEYCNEALLYKIVEKCENQKTFPRLECSELESCNLLQSFMNNKLNSVVELGTDKVLYSSSEELQTCAYNFWRAILSSTKEDGQFFVKIDCFPDYKDLRTTLDIYGFSSVFHQALDLWIQILVLQGHPKISELGSNLLLLVV